MIKDVDHNEPQFVKKGQAVPKHSVLSVFLLLALSQCAQGKTLDLVDALNLPNASQRSEDYLRYAGDVLLWDEDDDTVPIHKKSSEKSSLSRPALGVRQASNNGKKAQQPSGSSSPKEDSLYLDCALRQTWPDGVSGVSELNFTLHLARHTYSEGNGSDEQQIARVSGSSVILEQDNHIAGQIVRNLSVDRYTGVIVDTHYDPKSKVFILGNGKCKITTTKPGRLF